MHSFSQNWIENGVVKEVFRVSRSVSLRQGGHCRLKGHKPEQRWFVGWLWNGLVVGWCFYDVCVADYSCRNQSLSSGNGWWGVGDEARLVESRLKTYGFVFFFVKFSIIWRGFLAILDDAQAIYEQKLMDRRERIMLLEEVTFDCPGGVARSYTLCLFTYVLPLLYTDLIFVPVLERIRPSSTCGNSSPKLKQHRLDHRCAGVQREPKEWVVCVLCSLGVRNPNVRTANKPRRNGWRSFPPVWNCGWSCGLGYARKKLF